MVCSEPLETLKAELLRHAPKKKGRERTLATVKTVIPVGGPKDQAFDDVQSLWYADIKLVHQDDEDHKGQCADLAFCTRTASFTFRTTRTDQSASASASH